MFDIDFAEVKPSVINLFVITLMAVIGIVLLKYIFTRWPVPGVSDVIMAV